MATEHRSDDSGRPAAEIDDRLLAANEQLILKAIQSLEQAEESERRYVDQHVANKAVVQKQRQLRFLASELILTEQKQRKHLATELHDYLAQMMVLGRLKVGQVRSKLTAIDPSLAYVIGEIDEIFTQSLNYTRTLMAELSPPVLQELGLPSALKWLAEHMLKFGLHVEVHLSHDHVALPEDQRVLLYQSVRELLINVAKHAKTSRACLSLSNEGDHLRIVVRDDGSGFDAASVDARSEGVHFGLFSIRERMEAMSGWFQMDSTPGRGTTITLALPIGGGAAASEKRGTSEKSATGGLTARNKGDARDKRDSQDQEERPNVRLPLSNVSPVAPLSPVPLVSQHAPIRVLIVDDHAIIRQGLRTILEGYDDVTVVGEAGNGVEAVSMAAEVMPDIIVMDLNMPTMDGIEATKQIKADQPSVVVIGLSVNLSTQVVEAMKSAGASAFVSKEAAPDELHATIAALL
jgi:signal transduction histidine kinase